MTGEKVTIPRLMRMKQRGEKITMITAYDYPTARVWWSISSMVTGRVLG